MGSTPQIFTPLILYSETYLRLSYISSSLTSDQHLTQPWQPQHKTADSQRASHKTLRVRMLQPPKASKQILNDFIEPSNTESKRSSETAAPVLTVYSAPVSSSNAIWPPWLDRSLDLTPRRLHFLGHLTLSSLAFPLSHEQLTASWNRHRSRNQPGFTHQCFYTTPLQHWQKIKYSLILFFLVYYCWSNNSAHHSIPKDTFKP